MTDYFCVLPFFGLEINYRGSTTPCCLLPPEHQVDQIRNDMLNGRKSEFCSACWTAESAGLLSDRQLKNSALDLYWDRDIRFIEQDAREGKYKPIMIKHTASNLCNSTCVTCGSLASTAWATVEKRLNLVPKPSVTATKEQIDSKLDYKDIVTLNLMGGEPLYEKLNFYILEQLIAYGNTKCFLQFTTNGSVDISSDHKEILKKFNNINFNVSIDGVGPVFEYMRYPLTWNNLLKNLDFFRSITDNVNTSYTTSNVNLLYHHETIDWFKKENLRYHTNAVAFPTHFKPSALPKHIKNEIFKRNGKTADMNFFIGAEHSEEDDKNFSRMIEKIKLQDAGKGIAIQDYLPEFYNLISPYMS